MHHLFLQIQNTRILWDMVLPLRLLWMPLPMRLRVGFHRDVMKLHVFMPLLHFPVFTKDLKNF